MSELEHWATRESDLKFQAATPPASIAPSRPGGNSGQRCGFLSTDHCALPAAKNAGPCVGREASRRSILQVVPHYHRPAFEAHRRDTSFRGCFGRIDEKSVLRRL